MTFLGLAQLSKIFLMFYCTLAGFKMSFMYGRAMDTEGVKAGPKTLV